MRTVGLGLIGCGGMGRSLAENANQLENAEVVACYDVQPDASRAAASLLGSKTCQSLEELLGSPEIDGVIVATPGYLHARQVVQAAEAGKHVFCEKPMALTVHDCDEMISACRRNDVKLMVGQVLRLLPVFKECARIVREELGKPVAMRTTRIGGWGHSGWRNKLSLSGGMLLEVNVHELDYMRHLLGEAREVAAYGGRYVQGVDFEDTVHATFWFREGRVGTLEAAASSTIGIYNGTVICEDGSLAYDNGAGTIRYRLSGGEERVLNASQSVKVPYGVQEELADFVGSIIEDRDPIITGLDGREAVRMALAIRESIETGRVVRL